ncbi:MAG: hypothetical protein B7Y51_11390 [Burkholderiales bacterium 28-67-8]|nr:MAG: hypothetical protein B7Y51_11390 [Burkholderiales bacterium 28-67-8]
MDKINDLAEQHIRESASRLRNIDELMVRARATSKPELAPRTEALLMQIQADRNKLARELEEIQGLPRGEGSEIIKRHEGLNGLLESLGLQVEQVLGAVFERGRRP